MHPGYKKLNSSAINKLSKAIEADPEVDLEDVLQGLCLAYPRLRSNLENRLERRGSNKENEGEIFVYSVQVKDNPCWATSSSQSPFLDPATHIHVESPLGIEVLASLSLADCDYTLHDVARTLFYRLASQEPLAVNGRRSVVSLDSDIVVKIGPNLGTDELELLHLLAGHIPSLPAPRPLGQITIGALSYMFMTRVPGRILEERWPTLTLQQKDTLRTFLDSFLSELRTIPHASGSPLGSASDTPVCKDCRREVRTSTEPIYTESEFNCFLVRSNTSRASEGYRRWVLSMLRENHDIVLTHGDLHPGNIMVDIADDGHMSVGIIDWEMGGFYPEYWEMLKAMNTRAIDDESDWWEFLPPCILGYDQEIAVDRLIENTLVK